MILVIAEKPSVAQSIAKVLGATSRRDGYLEGNNYIVSWCVGHLVELADASSYDERYAKWRYEDLPIVPEKWLYEVPKDKAQQFKVLHDLLKDKRVTELICATDAGREGELIFRLVYNKAGCTKPFKRLWISSLEDSAIREGFAHLRDGSEFDRLYEAALCRSKADWIVGINDTRLFTTLYHKKLVVDRVQTPTLAMLAERDGKISTFKKEKYFNVHVNSGNLTADMEKVKTEDEAKTIAAACDKKQAVVSSVKRETKTVNPPKLYDLTTLQREANRYYGFTAQQTLDLVQSLYEKKLLTYPRTDSQFITDDMESTVRQVIYIVCRKVPIFDGLSYDKATNKQFITIQTKNGNTFYIVIDYDAPINEEEEQYQTYFLNMVDESDLLALMDEDSVAALTTCSCTEKCEAGHVNTSCPVCKTNMSECTGTAPEPEAPAEEPEPVADEKPQKNSNMGMIIVIIAVAGIGGAGYYYIKFVRGKKQKDEDMDFFDDEGYEEEPYINEEEEPQIAADDEPEEDAE